MTNIMNLTPHAISIASSDGFSFVSVPASGHTMRLLSHPQTLLEVMEYEGVSFDLYSSPKFMDTLDFPNLERYDAVLVSAPVGQLVESMVEKGYVPPCKILGPDTGPGSVVRDDQGQIVGVKRLIMYADRK